MTRGAGFAARNVYWDENAGTSRRDQPGAGQRR
jgi:hypothetical protein